MVRGGGHHQSSSNRSNNSSFSVTSDWRQHHHRSPWVGRSRGGPDVIIVNNNSQSRSPPSWWNTNTRSQQWDGGDMEVHDFRGNFERDGLIWNDHESSSRRTPNYRCIGLALSVIMVIVLLALSGINATWTLNAGESRRIETPILSRRITVSSPTSSSSKLEVVVYDLKSCPPLTGKPVGLQDERNMTLGVDEFRYDYFFLNAGSTIDVNAHQTEGTSDLYILEGANALRRLQSPSDEDPFGKDAVAHGFVEDGGDTNLNFKVKRSEIYTLAYDNAATRTGMLTTRYNVTLTTYDLHGLSPVCANLELDCRIARPDHGSCLLVQAKASRGSTQVVTVKLHGQRRWLPILVYSIAPYLLGWLAARVLKPKSSYQPVEFTEDQRHAHQENNVVDDEVHDQQENPPPTAPSTAPLEAVPSAPVEAEVVDQEHVPMVPAEYVVPIAAPVTTDSLRLEKEHA